MMLSCTRSAARKAFSTSSRRSFAAAARSAPRTTATPAAAWALAAGVTLTVTAAVSSNNKTQLAARIPVGGELIQTGTPVKERATGIAFPQLCNGYFLAGCGCRVKWGLVKVYAVGSYFDPLAMSAVKNSGKEAIQEALLNPTYPRTIRIVMNRNLSIAKFTEAIVESLEPRMKGKDLDKLDEFKKLNPPVDLINGAEIEITIRGDTMLYKNAVGGVGTIRSEAFTMAMCDVYYGADAVSPTHKDAVMAGIPKL